MRSLLFIALAALGIVALPVLGSDYALSFGVQLMMFTALAYSWNLIGGYAGYSHFGQVAFFGAGAYAGALLMGAGWHWLSAAACAGVFGAAIAVPLGGALLRLKGPFFAIGMFGMARVFEAFTLGFDGITQGGTGLYLPPVNSLVQVYMAFGALALALLIATWRLDNSRLGLQLLAIREDETAAEALGIRITRLKIGTFVASAIAPAAAGSLYATYLSFIDPATAFAPMTELTTISMVLLGGLGTVFGPLIGVVAMSVINEVLWSRFPEVYLMLVGVVILLAILYLPRGLVGLGGRNSALFPPGRGGLRRLADAKAKTPAPEGDDHA
jgi:branched-chain amino acid transport system permease protein